MALFGAAGKIRVAARSGAPRHDCSQRHAFPRAARRRSYWPFKSTRRAWVAVSAAGNAAAPARSAPRAIAQTRLFQQHCCRTRTGRCDCRCRRHGRLHLRRQCRLGSCPRCWCFLGSWCVLENRYSSGPNQASLAIVCVIDPVVPMLALRCRRVWLGDTFIAARAGHRLCECAGHHNKSEHRRREH